jgi:hypothetical protein
MLVIYLILCFPSFPLLLLYLLLCYRLFPFASVFKRTIFVPWHWHYYQISGPSTLFSYQATLFSCLGLLPYRLCQVTRDVSTMYTESQTLRLTCLCDWYLLLLLGVQELLSQWFRMWCHVFLSSIVQTQPINLEIFCFTDSVRNMMSVT